MDEVLVFCILLKLAYGGYQGYPFAASGRATTQSPTSGVNPVIIGILLSNIVPIPTLFDTLYSFPGFSRPRSPPSIWAVWLSRPVNFHPSLRPHFEALYLGSPPATWEGRFSFNRDIKP
jgi:hypothetical protein